jgi:opacity protein-like surface antigen
MTYLLKRIIKLTCVLTLLLFSAGTFAQIHVGVSGGVNLNQIQSPGMHTGFNLGGFASMDFSFLNVRAGLSYSQLGGGREAYSHSPGFGTVANQTYINRQLVFHNVEVPIYLNVTMPGLKEAAIKPRVTLGFVYGFNVSAIERYDIRFNFDDGLYAQVDNRKENVRGDMVPHHFDALVGFGFDFQLENERKVYFEVVYRQGLNQQNNVGFGRIGNIGKIYTNTVMFNLGITFF